MSSSLVGHAMAVQVSVRNLPPDNYTDIVCSNWEGLVHRRSDSYVKSKIQCVAEHKNWVRFNSKISSVYWFITEHPDYVVANCCWQDVAHCKAK